MKKQLLFMFTALCSITAMAQVPNYVPTSNLTAWYSFTGNANDGSTNGYNGTVNGATLTTDRFGNTNSSYNFNGTNNYISLPTGFTTGSASKSFSVWFYLTNGTYNFVLDGGTSVNGSSFGLFWNSNPTINKLTFHGDGTTYDYEFTDINFNQWYHTVITYDGTTVKSYLNGVYIGSKIVTLNTSTTSNIKVGCRNNTSAYFVGKIDDIGVWNRALTQQEITDLYNSNSCPNPPASAITPQSSTTFCTGGFVNLNANTGTGLTYQWYNNSGAIGGATNATYTASQSGNYTVKVMDGVCDSTSIPVTVTVNTPPSAAVNVSGATTFCSGNNVTLTAQGTGTYLWSNNATSNSITVNQSGNYSVTVTANGCSATSGITAVTVNQTPIASITPVGSTTFCQGGFVTLNASGGGTYQWNTSATSASINANQSNTYSVIVTSNGCSATASQVVTVNPLPNVTLGALGNLTNINAAPVTLSGSPSGGTYTGAGVSGTTFNPTTAGLGTHYIHYNYTTGAGCSGNAIQSTIVYDTTGLVCTTYDTLLTSVTDTLIIHAVLTGVNPPNNTNTIKVYPNPASDHIYINNGNYATMTGYSCTITNALSQQVFYSLINQQQFYIDLNTWTGHGIYFLTIRNAANSVIEVKKIVIQ